MLHRIGCELYIKHPTYSKKAFATLHEQKDAIEAELGQLDWLEAGLQNCSIPWRGH
jgi:hypothetical protein